MDIRSTQQKIYNILKTFCFFLGFFSIGASMFFWFNAENYTDMYIIKLHSEHIAIWIGIWTPTFFILSMIFDKMSDKLKG